ncbi:hypothetical protein TorRG33x02_275770 [Trema orientale]|uniref:Transmembrane protein n=1 Tax=Trema orientale TaxID=63057 RepID=A0A2P5CRN1_TREOI|nr:hypothetical protein TorRG33x02_275770 [Trema orientale]
MCVVSHRLSQLPGKKGTDIIGFAEEEEEEACSVGCSEFLIVRPSTNSLRLGFGLLGGIVVSVGIDRRLYLHEGFWGLVWTLVWSALFAACVLRELDDV